MNMVEDKRESELLSEERARDQEIQHQEISDSAAEEPRTGLERDQDTPLAGNQERRTVPEQPEPVAQSQREEGKPETDAPTVGDSANVAGGTLVSARTAFELGSRDMAQGKYDVARAHLEQALAVFEESGDRAEVTDVILELGILSLLEGKYDAAWERYERALAIRKELDDRYGQADILIQMGYIHYLRGKSTQAKRYYDRAQGLVKEI
jgi:tetratricopeptide (TPR) repeat protein